MADYILGLDLGPNSIGWAMLEAEVRDEDGTASIVEKGFLDTSNAGHPPMGARVFEAGLDNLNTSKEKSLSQKRRTSRSMRRNHARRNARRKTLLRHLIHADLFPGNPDERELLFKQNPYKLRTLALDERLDPHQLGRALYHLSQRRGFKSNRKSGKAKEDKGILKEIGQLAKDIESHGSRTLGEYFYHLSQDEPGSFRPLELGWLRIREQHTRRDMYEDEFQKIIESQQRFHPIALTDELIKKLHRAIFFQHPFELTDERRKRAPAGANLHRAPSVRPCPLEPDEKCCPKAEWIAQRFRILKEINNLKIAENFGLERALSEEERKTVIERLSLSENVTFDQIRSTLAKHGCDPEALFNLERGDRKKLNGNIIDSKLSAALGKKKWKELEVTTKQNLRNTLLHSEDPESLETTLIDAGFDKEKAEKLAGWNPPEGYIGFSEKALLLLVPHLESGLDEYEAIQKEYPDRPEGHEVDQLPALTSKDLPYDLRDITNPIVRRALVEVRKVMNALIREHGKPRRIVVELARDMKAGPEERKRYSRQRYERESLRDRARKEVEDLGGNPNSRNDINRWLYWTEQDHSCPYTNRRIPQDELFRGGEWEVDHILPHWQSLDDSMNNKALVLRVANEEKGDKTPAQWLGVESEEFRKLIQRVEGMVRKNGLPYPKLLRMKQEEVDTGDFALRQLNDTRYISKAVVKYLNLLFPPELRKGELAVQSCRGGLTWELRRRWGLNNVLDDMLDKEGNPVLSPEFDEDGEPKKSRKDHRHHAVDAVVVALSSRRNLKRYQDYWKKHSRSAQRPFFEDPWEGLRDDVSHHAKAINVSHRAVRKVDGPLHEETYFGRAFDKDEKPISDTYVTRKPIESLTGKMVKHIRDHYVRTLIETRLAEKGWGGKANALPKDWWIEGINIESKASEEGIPVRKVRIEEVHSNVVDLGHRFAKSGSNHHIVFFEVPNQDSDKQPTLDARIVSRMEVAKKVRQDKLPPISRNHGAGGHFIMSLCRKDSVLLSDHTGSAKRLCIVQSISTGTEEMPFYLVFRDARDSRPASEGNKTPFQRLVSEAAWHRLKLEKVKVDPLGRISIAND